MRKCEYCDFLSFKADDRTQREYVGALIKEIEYYGKLIGYQYEVTTVFLGGGTPSWLDTDLVVSIMNAIRQNFRVREDAEISIECNPGTVTLQKFAAYRNSGINRISIGCQSADNDELKLLGRVHTFEQFVKTFELARNVGFQNINVDLISCLPHQTVEKFMKTLQTVMRLKPEHISVYTLIIEEGTPFYEKYKFDAVKQQAGMETEDLPTDELSYRLYKHTMDFLEAKGYKRYEISNYARNGKICRHNVGYWDRVPYLGLGLGAASLFGNMRTSNVRDIYKYIETSEALEKGITLDCELSSPYFESEEIISKKDAMAEFMFLGLRKIDGIARADFYQMFDIDIEAIYGPVITALRNQGFMDAKEGRLFLTDIGIDVSNQVLSKFLLD